MKGPIQTFYNLNFLVDWMLGDVRDAKRLHSIQYHIKNGRNSFMTI